MNFTKLWINAYNSLLDLNQDPETGILKGTYSSTTGGTGTYDVSGWASLKNATEDAGQTIALSVLWRSNDGGKSDPSHEVSAFAGQVIFTNQEESLVLLHIFIETNPGTVPKTGIYPDKLVFTPKEKIPVLSVNSDASAIPDSKSIILKDNLTGIWKGEIAGKTIEIAFQKGPEETHFIGIIAYPNGRKYPICGFTDIFAPAARLNWQGISLSTYIDEPNGRKCMAMAGYLDQTTGKIKLTQITAESTSFKSTWYQTHMEQFTLEKKTNLVSR